MGRIFLAGESAGGTIAHNIAVRAGATGTAGFGVRGLIIMHPYFANEEPDKLIKYIYPTCSGLFEDPILNPEADPDLSKLGCSRVFVCVGEQDWLKPRGVGYYEILKRSGYGGTVEFVETEESAGANLAHYVAVRAGATGLVGVKLNGLIMLHSYFVTSEPEAIMPYLYPTCSGLDDPLLNPGADPDLAKLGCPKVFLCVAENDWLKQRGLDYYEMLKKSGWGGTVEFMENEGEGHCFHLFNPTCEKALDLFQALESFINQK
ncbi:hypothetical protein RJ640_016528 [Escallonia rubra]|uniref:Alpha/beta hydrolase fold-3 domain-containing protein n=1 Tax=Escallonia rubra TaxID=112253 RepID=A0AA88RV96_9ASTE|nr:hypothetical protein RJ640_016528 [Escallonia rubra]